ncbi:hypothetical protein F5972_27945 [Microbispora cellulosiformans]|uniref:Uncharacterized protein n=1 Tax=Microbispora cellulosiformans TaxID=2614688 RepID=A0A5J5JVF8_9ACTN|nr:hypothetical protein [Microbispora cellulosiformans]KAA9375212.1 hypothetical protein F5972_27945 [Microbispora cellulosiformans]
MPAPDVAALLAQLERSEPDIAEPARVAVEWLAGGEALETISQFDVCEFLWYTLPIKVPGDQATIARALGKLLRLAGMERYAALCDSPATARILLTYAREGEEAGTSAYHRELESTGVLPPDVAELSWSSIMGPEELGAHVACAAALELAIVAGEPVDREELTRRWLTAPRTELGGDCWLHRVHGERLNRWVLGRGTARRELAQPFEVRLHAPIEAPAEPHLEPLRWLLDLARTGVRLTERLNVGRAVAAEAAGRFGWAARTGLRTGARTEAPGAGSGTEPRAVRGEADVPAMTELRRIAVHDLGALRRSGRRLVLTTTGRNLLDDPAALWEAAAATLLVPAPGEHDFEISIRESALMILVDGDAVPDGDLRDRVAEVVNGEGWRSADGGRVTGVDLSHPLARLRHRLDALGLAADGVRASESPAGPSVAGDREPSAPARDAYVWRLTGTGRRAALAALRAQALRPRQYAGLG